MNKRLYVRYYDKNGNYLDHGRMMLDSIPQINEIIHPFKTTKGDCNWRIIKIEIPENDSCYEFHIEDIGEIK